MADVSSSTFNTPTLWINEYLKEKIGLDTGIGVPFFPSRPASIDELTESWITITPASTNNKNVKIIVQKVSVGPANNSGQGQTTTSTTTSGGTTTTTTTTTTIPPTTTTSTTAVSPTTTTTTSDPFFYYVTNQYRCPDCNTIIGTNVVIKSFNPLSTGDWLPWSSGSDLYKFNILSSSSPNYMATLISGTGASTNCGC